MDLQEQVNALTTERDQYKDALEQVNAERIALDQMYVNSLKDAVKDKKELILNNDKLNSLQNSLCICQKEKESLQIVIDGLQAKLDAFESQSVICLDSCA